MRCNECGKENILEARFCGGCGSAFTDEQPQSAYDETVFGSIEKAKTIRSYLDGSFITGTVWFKVLSLAVVLVIALMARGGQTLRVAESDAYTVQYNRESKETYLLTDEDQVSINLYVPAKTDLLQITSVDTATGEILSQTDGTVEEQVVLNAVGDQITYRITAGKQVLAILVYQTPQNG